MAKEAFVVRQSKRKVFLLGILSTAFVALGYWLAFHYDGPRAIAPIAGWAAMLFFGLCFILWIRRLFDKGIELLITGDGIRYARWSDQTILWNDITEIFEFSIQKQRMIGISLKDPGKYPGKGMMAKLAGANKALSGADISVPGTGLDKTIEEIMAAIQKNMP